MSSLGKASSGYVFSSGSGATEASFSSGRFKAISFATRLAIGTALSPVAPISGLIFFLEKRLNSFTKRIPPAILNAKARKPPTTIPIVVQFKKASVVMVAPTESPRKMVAAFMMLLEAASNRRNVLLPISFTRLPNINIPIKGTALGTKRATTVVTTIGKTIFKTRITVVGGLPVCLVRSIHRDG